MTEKDWRLPTAREVKFQKIGATAGTAAPILGFVCILIAIASYPQFSWTNNALSDLGVVPGVTGIFFNFGLFGSGVLSLIYAVFGLFPYLGQRWVGKVGSAVFLAANFALMAIGIFNENFSPTHYLVSVAFFVLAPISLFILTYAFWLVHQRGMAVFTVIVAVAAALPWLLQFTFNYVTGVAIPEAVSGLAISVWVILLARKMVKASSS